MKWLRQFYYFVQDKIDDPLSVYLEFEAIMIGVIIYMLFFLALLFWFIFI